MSSTAEYDGFGPWIYEIRTREEIPRLFSDYPLDLETAVLTIKVPRVIDRRDANPAMDLYDILLSLGPDKLNDLHEPVASTPTGISHPRCRASRNRPISSRGRSPWPRRTATWKSRSTRRPPRSSPIW